MSVPAAPKIYHITHVDNLKGIVQSGVLWSDAQRITQSLECSIVGMSAIKHRRLEEQHVTCHPGTLVGEYVPFYFCPRSVMLYILYRGNHPDITYRGGQNSIVHLAAELHAVVAWAESRKVNWAFSDTNAGARYARFFSRIDELGYVNWAAVQARDFQNDLIKERKQAEFLVYESFPWELVTQIGVQNNQMKFAVEATLARAEHRPLVSVEPDWYY